MRTLCFTGKFGYIKEEIHDGFIVFCHFEPFDNEKIISKAIKKISKRAKDKIVLVPFSHLHENVAPKKEAKIFFEYLITNIKEISKNVIIIPFGVEKEFYLYAPAKHSAVKFMNFK